jgi:hypothetical protein
MSDSPRFLEVERLYHAAVARPLEERAPFLDQACAYDPSLRNEVESLLQHDRPDDSDFLDACSAPAWRDKKKYAEAEPLLLEGYRGMLARKDRMKVEDWYHLERAHEWMSRLYQAWRKPERAGE